MLIAAASMTPRDFTIFSLFMLASNTLVGLFRAALFQPALISQRFNERAFVPLRYALLSAVIAGLVMLGASYAFGARGLVALISIAVSGMFPVLFEWLRYRAMGQDRRWILAQADLIRMLLTAASLLMAPVRTNSVAL